MKNCHGIAFLPDSSSSDSTPLASSRSGNSIVCRGSSTHSSRAGLRSSGSYFFDSSNVTSLVSVASRPRFGGDSQVLSWYRPAEMRPVLPTSKPFGPVLVKPGTRPGVSSGLVGLVGHALRPEQRRPRRNRYRPYPRYPERALSIHICGLRLRFLVWILLSTVTTFQPHSAPRR
jgi:hypothetical protein